MNKFKANCLKVGSAFAASALSFGLLACAGSSNSENSGAVPPAVAEMRAANMAPADMPRYEAPSAPVTIFELKALDKNKQVRVVEKPTLAAPG